jgi:hypothetical protein
LEGIGNEIGENWLEWYSDVVLWGWKSIKNPRPEVGRGFRKVPRKMGEEVVSFAIDGYLCEN